MPGLHSRSGCRAWQGKVGVPPATNRGTPSPSSSNRSRMRHGRANRRRHKPPRALPDRDRESARRMRAARRPKDAAAVRSGDRVRRPADRAECRSAPCRRRDRRARQGGNRLGRKPRRVRRRCGGRRRSWRTAFAGDARRAPRASAIFGPTGCWAKRISVAPASAAISASASVAHLHLWMPAANCIRITADILCVLMCGQSRSVPPAMAIILRSSPRSGRDRRPGRGSRSRPHCRFRTSERKMS